MLEKSSKEFAEQLIEKALEFGADLAGIASVEALRRSPSQVIYGRLDDYKGVGSRQELSVSSGKFAWPANAGCAVVVAIEHREEKPDLDWWQEGYRGGTPGNRFLISIIADLAGWLEKEKRLKSHKLSYFIERGGIFLKDAAVLAGLGCIGKNNILITPKYGPRVRLRAMLLDVELPPTGPVDFDPCADCDIPCRAACPQKAFQDKVYLQEEFGMDTLPGRTGVFSRYLCNIQMEMDIDHSDEIAIEGKVEGARRIKYCRRCEFACPVGRG